MKFVMTLLAFLAITALSLIVSFPRVAQAEEVLLGEFGAWNVNLGISDNTGDLYCSMATTNSQGDVLSLAMGPEGGSHLVAVVGSEKAPWSKDRWSDVYFDIDYSPWALRNARLKTGWEASVVSFTFGYFKDFAPFLRDIRKGNAIAFKHPNRRANIATWSLRGSYAASEELLSCAEKIRTPQQSSL